MKYYSPRGVNQYPTLDLRLSTGVICKVTKRWWERFLDGEIKRLTNGVEGGVTSLPRGTVRNGSLEQETGRRGQHANAAR
jgi:hypothetical protein